MCRADETFFALMLPLLGKFFVYLRNEQLIRRWRDAND